MLLAAFLVGLCAFPSAYMFKTPFDGMEWNHRATRPPCFAAHVMVGGHLQALHGRDGSNGGSPCERKIRVNVVDQKRGRPSRRRCSDPNLMCGQASPELLLSQTEGVFIAIRPRPAPLRRPRRGSKVVVEEDEEDVYTAICRYSWYVFIVNLTGVDAWVPLYVYASHQLMTASR